MSVTEHHLLRTLMLFGSTSMIIYLYVKTHLKTGLKYLGKTEKDPYVYKGSGFYWKRHIKKHDNDVWTNVIFQSELKKDIKEIGLYYSNLWNVVESEDWANIRPETGDGGDTVSKKKWITNGTIDKYLDTTQSIPEGWVYGRSKCIFNDPEKQKEFSYRADHKKGGETLSKLWKEGIIKKSEEDVERLRKWFMSEDNPSKSPLFRQKIIDYHNRKKNNEPIDNKKCE